MPLEEIILVGLDLFPSSHQLPWPAGPSPYDGRPVDPDGPAIMPHYMMQKRHGRYVQTDLVALPPKRKPVSMHGPRAVSTRVKFITCKHVTDKTLLHNVA